MYDSRSSHDASRTQAVTATETAAARTVIEHYYAAFNQRRFVEGSALFTEDAVLEQLLTLKQERGAIGYLQFVSAWLRAFPDAAFDIRHMSSEDGRTFDVMLDATGTHRGALDFGGWKFRPTGLRASFGVRELLECATGRLPFQTSR
jgi:predicted ester cyclase